MIVVLTLLILLAILVTRMANADSKVVQQDDAANPQTLGYATPARCRAALAVVVPTAAIHFAAFVALFFFTFSRGMSRFDSGADPSALERVADVAFAVLSFPVLPLLRAGHFHVPGRAGWLVFAANSLLWGLALWLVVRSLRRLWPTAYPGHQATG